MKIVNVKEKNLHSDELLLTPLGDCHYGSKDCDVKKLKDTINWIKSKPNARVILMGDLIDVGLRDSVGGGTFDNTVEPEDQINTMIELLLPIKDKIWCMLGGNHEERIRMKTSIDVNKLIAKALDTRYCGSATFIKAHIDGINYIIFASHGNTGALTASGKLNSVMKYSSYIDADLYLMGHVHELMHHTTDYFKVNIKDKMVVKDKHHYVITGHFLKYGGYAEQKGYAPGKSGVSKIILKSDKKGIYVSI